MASSIVLERVLSTTNDDQIIPSQLIRRRVYILPTREGFIFSVVLLTMLLGAINYNNNMAYLLTFLLGSVFMVAILHTYRNLAGLIITSSSPKPVFAGETAIFPLLINNRSGQIRPSLSLVCKPKRNKKLKNITTQGLPVLTDIPADQLHVVEIRKPANQRGLLVLGRIIIATRYPLGLFRAWSYFDIDKFCVVYPRPDGSRQLPPPMTAREQGLSGIKAGADDFAGFRYYHPGDSVRNIAWKALAREQPLLVKRFSGEGNRTLMLNWDSVSRMPDTESRLSQLCLWILQAEREGMAYGLDIPRTHIEPDQGILHRNRCLEVLACYGHPHE